MFSLGKISWRSSFISSWSFYQPRSSRQFIAEFNSIWVAQKGSLPFEVSRGGGRDCVLWTGQLAFNVSVT